MSNSKKSLLNENTIRRFMKLAEIDKLSDGFVDGLVQEAVEEVEEIEEGMHADMAYARDDEEEVEAAAAEMDELLPADEEELEVDMEMEAPEEMEMEEPAEPAGVDLAADLARGVAAVIQDVLGVSVDVEAPEAAPAEEEAEEMEMDMEEPAPEEMEAEEEEEMMMEDDMIAEITNRVLARLQEEGKDDATADQLAERIIQRIKDTSDQ